MVYYSWNLITPDEIGWKLVSIMATICANNNNIYNNKMIANQRTVMYIL